MSLISWELLAVYLFGSWASEETTPLSDVDLAYLGADREAESRLFDPLYEALQG
ncbi:MAG: nucleotidyltransferase domain-containing protein [Candidatus Tectomicrobia bacterium]